MEKIKAFIAERGLALMLYGMGGVLAGAVSYMLMKQRWAVYSETIWPSSAMAFAFVGVAVYIVGRVSIVMQRKRQAKAPQQSRDDDE